MMKRLSAILGKLDLPVLLLLAELAWIVLFSLSPDGIQNRVFGCPPNWFSDFYLVRAQAVAAPEEMLTYAACDRSSNPLFFALFTPFPLSEQGAILQLSIMTGLLWGMVLLAGRKFGLSLWKAAAFFLIMPCLFNFERANTLPLAAACVAFFLVFYDSKIWFLRQLSLVVLGFAVSLKITPAAFAFLLLLDRRIGDCVRVAFFAACFMIVPYVFTADFIGGVKGLVIGCAQNGMVKHGSWGFSFLARCVADVCGLENASWWPIVRMGCRAADVSLSVALLVMVVRRKNVYLRLFGLSAIMLFLPPNAMHYCGMYLIVPAIAFACRSSGLTGWKRCVHTLLWLAVLSPLQFWGQTCGMRPFSNLALIALAGLTLLHSADSSEP